jgi:hypothetical protein
VPEGMIPKPPGTGCMAPPRAPHSLHLQKVPPLEASLVSKYWQCNYISDQCQENITKILTSL